MLGLSLQKNSTAALTKSKDGSERETAVERDTAAFVGRLGGWQEVGCKEGREAREGLAARTGGGELATGLECGAAAVGLELLESAQRETTCQHGAYAAAMEGKNDGTGQ